MSDDVDLKSPVTIERRLADDAGCDLHILILQGGDDFRGREILVREPARIEPDAHTVFPGAENIDISDAFNPLELLAHLQGGVVADVELVVGIVRRNHVHHQE